MCIHLFYLLYVSSPINRPHIASCNQTIHIFTRTGRFVSISRFGITYLYIYIYNNITPDTTSLEGNSRTSSIFDPQNNCTTGDLRRISGALELLNYYRIYPVGRTNMRATVRAAVYTSAHCRFRTNAT